MSYILIFELNKKYYITEFWISRFFLKYDPFCKMDNGAMERFSNRFLYGGMAMGVLKTTNSFRCCLSTLVGPESFNVFVGRRSSVTYYLLLPTHYHNVCTNILWRTSIGKRPVNAS